MILYPIGEDGPLVELDKNTGWSIDKLVWSGDIPHGQSNEGKCTAETLCATHNHMCDYLDNTCGDMFMK